MFYKKSRAKVGGKYKWFPRACVNKHTVNTQDLGEAIHGDVPAVNQVAFPNKGEQERRDLLLLAQSLDSPLKAEILTLWDDYENALSPEAKAVKAMDKLETLLQHTQGLNLTRLLVALWVKRARPRELHI